MNNAKIFIDGNLVRDPEVRDVKGNSVASFTVAVSTNIKNQDGSYKSDFYEVSAWGKMGEMLMQRLQKGSRVWCTGEFTTSEYVGRDKEKHLSLKVRADDVRGLARLKGESQQGSAPAKNAAAKTASFVSQDDESEFPF